MSWNQASSHHVGVILLKWVETLKFVVVYKNKYWDNQIHEVLFFDTNCRNTGCNNIIETKYSRVDRGCFRHRYINFGHTNLGVLKSNLK